MSVYSNQGPFKKLKKSGSQNSLYTDKSDQSDDIIKLPNTRPQIQIQQQQKKVQKSHKKLPDIKINLIQKAQKEQKHFQDSFINDSAERHAIFNEKIVNETERDEKIPQIPKYGAKKQEKFKSSMSIEVRGLTKGKSNKRYNFHQQFDVQAGPMNGRSFQVKEVGKNLDYEPDRPLKSSQGGRWLRSQSLSNQKDQKSFKYLIRHYHKHNSIMFDNLVKFSECFEQAQKSLLIKPYKISIYDSLQNIKLKMESFLQRRINLDNITSQKPTAEWNQQQLTNYYTNYRSILIKNDTHNQQYHQPYMLKKYKNCVFFGRMNNNKKQQGILHYFNGKCFEGNFKDDQKQYGLEIDQKQFYIGEFRKGLRHGEGILKTAEAFYVGMFTYGQFSNIAHNNKDESGTNSLLGIYNTLPSISNKSSKKGFEITLSAIKIYESSVIILKNNSGDIFIGNLNENDEKTDDGLQIFANGDIYMGRYEAGSPQGYGQYYWENGAYYRGQFLSGMRHGRGTWHMLNGDLYEGQYMNDKKNGKGTYIWKNGSKYTGNFENDYRHGYGEMYWQDGRVYKGKWLNGIEKNTVIKLEGPKVGKGKSNVAFKGSFRTIQHENKKKIPLDKLKSLYNPSYN